MPYTVGIPFGDSNGTASNDYHFITRWRVKATPAKAMDIIAMFTTIAAMQQKKTPGPLRNFDPIKVARYEKDSWVAYYQRRWFTLLRLLIGLIRSTYGLSWWQAIRVGIPATRAQLAFAPEDNNVLAAIEFMRQFFAQVKAIHHEDYDPIEVARAEVSWWVVHRKFFGRSDRPEMTEAVACAYSTVHDLPPSKLWEAAQYRAQAMVYSDAWVQSARNRRERDPDSRLLVKEETALIKSYTALKKAVS